MNANGFKDKSLSYNQGMRNKILKRVVHQAWCAAPKNSLWDYVRGWCYVMASHSACLKECCKRILRIHGYAKKRDSMHLRKPQKREDSRKIRGSRGGIRGLRGIRGSAVLRIEMQLVNW